MPGSMSTAQNLFHKPAWWMTRKGSGESLNHHLIDAQFSHDSHFIGPRLNARLPTIGRQNNPWWRIKGVHQGWCSHFTGTRHQAFDERTMALVQPSNCQWSPQEMNPWLHKQQNRQKSGARRAIIPSSVVWSVQTTKLSFGSPNR